MLLDNDDASLDEVLAFIDSYDFSALSTIGDCGNSTEFLDKIEIESMLIGDSLPTHVMQQPAQVTPLVADVKHASSDPPISTRRSSSAELRWPMIPTKERGRVRERIARLRDVVKQLEHQLQVLNVQSKKTSNVPPSSDENSTETLNAATDGDVVSWRQLATRQYAARREAEKENASLRERLEEQIRVAKRLEHLIQGQLPSAQDLLSSDVMS